MGGWMVSVTAERFTLQVVTSQTFLCLSTTNVSPRHYAAMKRRHQHSSDKRKADWGCCHRRNKWAESLSQAMFLSPLTWLHDCAGTFMDWLIRRRQIKTKSSQTGSEARPWRVSRQKNKHFINNKTLLYLIFSLWFNLFSSTFFSRSTFFLLVKMGFVLMSWA